MNETELQHLFDTDRTNTPISHHQFESVMSEARKRRRSRNLRRKAAVTTVALVAVATAATITFQPDSSMEIVASETDTEATEPTMTPTAPPDTATSTTTTPPETAPSTTPPVTANNPDLLESGLASRGGHSVVWIDGQLLIWGGFSDETGTAQFTDGAVFDRTTGQWTSMPTSPLDPRWNHLTEALDQVVVIVGGNVGSFSETFTREAAIFDLSNMTWQSLDDAPFAIGAHTAREWIDGDLYLVDPATGATAAFNLETQTWKEIAPLNDQDLYDNVVLVSDSDRLFALQGRCGAVALSSLTAGSQGWTLHEERAWRAPSANANGITHQYCLSAVADIDGEITVWAEPEDTGTAALTLNITASQLGDREPLPPSEGCDTSPLVQTFRSGATAIVDPCGSTIVFDPNQQQKFEVESAGGVADAVWTGGSMIVWGRPCCYGTGTSNPFTIEVNELAANSLS